MKSEFGKLKTMDFWKALVVAGFSSAITTLSAAIAMVTDYATFEWKTLVYAFGIGMIGGFSGYLSKNSITNSDGQMFTKESTETNVVNK